MPSKKTIAGPGKPPAATRRSRVYSISLPPELAARAEAIAAEESRTISEVFRNALRCYERERDRTSRMFDEIAAYVKTLPPSNWGEEDVPRLVKETRAGMRTERERQTRKAG